MLRRASLALATFLLLSACSGSGGSDELTRVPESEQNPLSPLVVAAPNGYETSTESDTLNGTMSPEQFGEYLHDSGAAEGANLVRAYQATYDSVENVESSILVVLAELGSAADAEPFTNLSTRAGPFKDTRADPAVKPRVRKLAGVPGGTLIEPRKIDHDGIYDHAAVAVKGNVVMFIDYITVRSGGVPLLPKIAREQFARL